MAVTPRALINKLNATCQKALTEAIATCNARGHFNVELEHWLLALLNNTNNDLAFLLRQYAIDAAKVKRELEKALERFKTGNTRGTPALGEDVLNATREAWVLGSLEQGANRVRSAHLLAAALGDRIMGDGIRGSSPELGRISVEKLLADLKELLPRVASEENDQEASAAALGSPDSAKPQSASKGGKTPALDQFTVNLTANAKAGKIDP
ncbi:MAG TPA: Clp protease N-terminal domain-containing protein, partial [Gemmata sp.]|nr:Clp protease N-terminal domain-containing protein [Gemmata sp.]